MGLTPEVTFNVQQTTTLAVPGAVSIVYIMGTASWGILDTIQTFNSFTQLRNAFKSGVLVNGADMAYRGGASTVKVIRIEDGSAALATKDFLNTATPVITVDGIFKGTFGNNIAVTITTNGSNRDIEITDGTITEIFNNAGVGFSTNALIVAAVNASTTLVKLTELDPTLVDATTKTFLVGGLDGLTVVAGDYTTAFDTTVLDNYDIFLTPGQTADAFHSTIIGKIEARNSTEKKAAIYFSGISSDESIATAVARTAVSTQARFALVAPGGVDLTATTVVDGSFLAALYAGKVASLEVEQAPTHKALPITSDQLTVDSTTGKTTYITAEQEQLLEKGITPITQIGNFVAAVRGVTANGDITDVFYELNIRRIVDFVIDNSTILLNPFIGERNIERKRAGIKSVLDNFLSQAPRDEVITEFSTEVTLNSSDPTTVDVAIELKPTFSINFINVTITI